MAKNYQHPMNGGLNLGNPSIPLISPANQEKAILANLRISISTQVMAALAQSDYTRAVGEYYQKMDELPVDAQPDHEQGMPISIGIPTDGSLAAVLSPDTVAQLAVIYTDRLLNQLGIIKLRPNAEAQE